MKLIYPAVFTPYFDEGGYDVSIPDLPDCFASGDTLAEAIEDAVNQASGAILSIMEKGGDVPPASEYQDIKVDDEDDFVSLIVLDMGAYSDAHAQKSVRKNITIPAWLNAYGEAHHVNFSRVLQDALLSMTQKKRERHKNTKPQIFM
ncbi:MAG: type II toxin-antitoxin system HicB family antitoxin [Lachnospiraceae bacterium]|nr:type II toxin-antitoxin system HicB family antitoxin [Lachnospiraceae bacterium]